MPVWAALLLLSACLGAFLHDLSEYQQLRRLGDVDSVRGTPSAVVYLAAAVLLILGFVLQFFTTGVSGDYIRLTLAIGFSASAIYFLPLTSSLISLFIGAYSFYSDGYNGGHVFIFCELIQPFWLHWRPLEVACTLFGIGSLVAKFRV